jgi:nicotinamidase-related amidase
VAWEKHFKTVDYILKGTNPWTEHYSAIQADVPDPNDTGTQLNVSLIDSLQQADICAVSGEALSHCVANTLSDIAHHLGRSAMQKFILLEDTTSPVPGFEAQAEQCLAQMETMGMQRVKSTDFFKRYFIA